MTLNEYEIIASIIASAVTSVGVIIALVFGILEIRAGSRSQQESKRANQMQALISFDQMLDNYHHVHSALRPGGDLTNQKELTHKQKVDIERYMGLFERAKVLEDDNFLPIERFRNLYGYRLKNLAKQPWVRQQKLIKNHMGWEYFLSLYESLYPEDHKKILEAINNNYGH